MTSQTVIEKLSLVAPFGVCLHDAATGERVADGLNVAVYAANQSAGTRRDYAAPNRSGVFVVQKIRGLENFARGAGDAEFWKENPPSKTYVVEVFDVERRFLPFRFLAALPVRGIYRWEIAPAASPNKTLPSVPLYSAPTRRTAGAMSIIRAELRRADANPASWAVLEARINNSLIARGIADKNGRVVLIFPTPAPANKPLVSPPAAAVRASLSEQKWTLNLTVKYQPSIFQTSPPISMDANSEFLPDLRLALAQTNGALWANAAQTERFKTAVLQVGRELILRSRASGSASPPDSSTAFSSFLLTSPAV